MGHIVLIFIHYYGDPDCYTKEEMKKKSVSNLSLIFEKKVINVSNPVKFFQLKRIYVNNSKLKNKKKEANNNKYIKQIINEIFNLTKN